MANAVAELERALNALVAEASIETVGNVTDLLWPALAEAWEDGVASERMFYGPGANPYVLED